MEFLTAVILCYELSKLAVKNYSLNVTLSVD